jgi:exopolysaccharide biosynthesis polyprenyl glycosylphosphotransferase
VDHKNLSRTTAERGGPAVIRVDPDLLPRGSSLASSSDSGQAVGSGASRKRSGTWRSLIALPARSTSLLYLSETVVLLGYVFLETRHWRLLLGLWLLTIFIFRARGLYQPRLTLSVLDDLPVLLSGLLLADFFVAAVMTRIHGNESLVDFAKITAAGGLGHMFTRAVTYHLIHRSRRSPAFGYRTIVVGSGDVSRKIVRLLDERLSLGLKVVGYVDDEPSPRVGSASWRYLGPLESLPAVMDTFDVQVLVVGFGRIRDHSVTDLVRQHRLKRAALFIVPRLFEVGRLGRSADHIGGIPVTRLSTAPVGGIHFVPKRLFDLVGAGLAVLVLSPLLLLIWALVRIDGGPGVLFRQNRVGRDGRSFDVWKFRSMAPERSTVADTQWSDAAAARVTPLGRILRATSLDELPQLFNVLRGNMSLVGPRPERPHFVVQFSSSWPHYQHRHRMPVGMTGLAQSNGLRGDTSIDDRARLDNYYIENWSLWLDVKVLLRTAGQVIGAKGR